VPKQTEPKPQMQEATATKKSGSFFDEIE
jgi:hypothetical protein